MAQNTHLFPTPTAEEGAFGSQIYAVQHFQQNVELQKVLRGGHNADPFVIANAAVNGGAVVTMELPKLNAAKIPNICEPFSVECLTLKAFMDAEGWSF